MEKATHRNHSHLPKTLRKALWDKKAELLIALGINRQGLGDSERKSEEDQVLVCQDEFVRLRLNQVFYGQLCQVESALERMDSGEYGTCVGCGSLIPVKRLQAVPWARYCLDCQEKSTFLNPLKRRWL